LHAVYMRALRYVIHASNARIIFSRAYDSCCDVWRVVGGWVGGVGWVFPCTVCTRVCMDAWVYTHIDMHTHAYTCAHGTDAYTHRHAHARIHMHTHSHKTDWRACIHAQTATVCPRKRAREGLTTRLPRQVQPRVCVHMTYTLQLAHKNIYIRSSSEYVYI
jgi:hypothetical protein